MRKDSLFKSMVRKKLDSYIEGKLQNIQDKLDSNAEGLLKLNQTVVEGLESRTDNTTQILDLLKVQRDQIPALKRQLEAARRTTKYKKVMEHKEPLVTIRIATYNRGKILTERTIPSILAQTYQNFEIVIVGDCCTDDTDERIRSLGDERIRFYNFPKRNVYPDNPHHKWMVAGSPGMNMGVDLAKGDWIAPLDDDDTFTPDHIEKLLQSALSSRSEMAVGALVQKNQITNEEKTIWSDPLELGKFSFQGAIYMKLLDFFRYDEESWVMREPGDWNLCRRMIQAGVSISIIKDVVGAMYMTPYNKKTEDE